MNGSWSTRSGGKSFPVDHGMCSITCPTFFISNGFCTILAGIFSFSFEFDPIRDDDDLLSPLYIFFFFFSIRLRSFRLMAITSLRFLSLFFWDAFWRSRLHVEIHYIIMFRSDIHVEDNRYVLVLTQGMEMAVRFNCSILHAFSCLV